jgi:hypothetical protein
MIIVPHPYFEASGREKHFTPESQIAPESLRSFCRHLSRAMAAALEAGTDIVSHWPPEYQASKTSGRLINRAAGGCPAGNSNSGNR